MVITDEIAAAAGDLQNAFVQPDVQRLALSHAPVVLDRFLAGRLIGLDREWVAANLDQLGRRKEFHVRGITHDGIDESALFDDARLEAFASRLDGAGEAHRPASYDDEVQHGF